MHSFIETNIVAPCVFTISNLDDTYCHQKSKQNYDNKLHPTYKQPSQTTSSEYFLTKPLYSSIDVLHS